MTDKLQLKTERRLTQGGLNSNLPPLANALPSFRFTSLSVSASLCSRTACLNLRSFKLLPLSDIVSTTTYLDPPYRTQQAGRIPLTKPTGSSLANCSTSFHYDMTLGRRDLCGTPSAVLYKIFPYNVHAESRETLGDLFQKRSYGLVA